MEKLTSADVQELTWWFSTPAPSSEAGRLGAQTYEPRGGGVYDPTMDMRLEHLVEAAISRSQSEWTRVKRVLEHVAEGESGRSHVEVLRRAFSPLPASAMSTDDFRFPEVAIGTEVLRTHAIAVSVHDEHVRLLEIAQLNGIRDRVSPMTIACRVAATDALLEHGFVVTDDMVRASTRRLLERTVAKKPTDEDLELRVQVKLEMQRRVDDAGGAYRRSRAALGASRRADRAAQRKSAEASLDALLGKKRERESARLDARMRRAS